MGTENTSRNRSMGVALLVLCVTVVISGCVVPGLADRAYHVYVMRGKIVDASPTEVYLCIGERDGAKVDQVLDVYKVTKVSSLGQLKTGPRFRRERTGTVRITEIVDQHFARAVIVEGLAEEDYIVELEQK